MTTQPPESDRRARRKIDLEIGALCRTQREQAGISLEEMARRVHRDPSSLSRFERGLVRPRDSEVLIAAYRQLGAPALAQQQTRRAVHWWPIAYLACSVTVLMVLIGVDHVDDDITLHSWLIVSALVLAVVIGRRVRQHYHSGQVRLSSLKASYTFVLLSTAVGNVYRFDQRAYSPQVAVFVVALAFGYLAVILADD